MSNDAKNSFYSTNDIAKKTEREGKKMEKEGRDKQTHTDTHLLGSGREREKEEEKTKTKKQCFTVENVSTIFELSFFCCCFLFLFLLPYFLLHNNQEFKCKFPGF